MSKVLPENSFPERIRALISLYGNKEKLAKACGISAVMLGKYEAGSEPSRDKLVALAKATGVRIEWLVTGSGPMKAEGEEPQPAGIPYEGWSSLFIGEGGGKEAGPAAVRKVPTFTDNSDIAEGYVTVPRYDVAASAGAGALVANEQVVDYIQFKPEWIKNVLGASAQHLALISVKGDSMEPTLSNGDTILVDTTDRRFDANAIYVLQLEGSLLVKRIQRKVDGTVVIKSDNKAYEPESVRGDMIEQLHVVGRVVWYGRRG